MYIILIILVGWKIAIIIFLLHWTQNIQTHLKIKRMVNKMAIETVLKCDKCGKSVLTLPGPYHIAKKEMKEKGWKNVKIDDEWQIHCPKCQGGKG